MGTHVTTAGLRILACYCAQRMLLIWRSGNSKRNRCACLRRCASTNQGQLQLRLTSKQRGYLEMYRSMWLHRRSFDDELAAFDLSQDASVRPSWTTVLVACTPFDTLATCSGLNASACGCCQSRWLRVWAWRMCPASAGAR